MCYKCKNTGRYANECPEKDTVATSNKKGSSLLIYKNDKHDSSSDEENHHYGMGNNRENIHTITEGSTEEVKCEESDSEIKEATDDNVDSEDNTTISEDDKYDRLAFLQEDIVCSNHKKAAIPKSWILLDSQSTVKIFSNRKLITNMRESKCVLTLHCNAG